MRPFSSTARRSQVECLVEVVQGNHGGHGQCVNNVQNRQLVLDIQVVGRFVQQQDLRALGQGASDMHALTLAAREATPRAPAKMRRIDVAQGLMDDVFVRLSTMDSRPTTTAFGPGQRHRTH